MNNDDQQRLVISLGVIATAIAAYTLVGTDNIAWLLFRAAITVQAVLAFLYVLYLAGSLKFKGSGSLFDIRIPAKIGALFYDQSVELFWATIFSGGLLLAYTAIPGEWRANWLIISLVALIIAVPLITTLIKLVTVLSRRKKI